MVNLIIFIFLFLCNVDICIAKGRSYIKGGLSSPSLTFKANNEGTEVDPIELLAIEYEPEVPLVGFLGFAWNSLSLSYSQQLEEDDTSMTFTDYSLGLEFSWIGTEISYSEFSKFKVATGNGFDDDLESSEKHRDDLDVRLITSNTYIFPIRWGYDHSAALEPSAIKSTSLGLGIVLSANQLKVTTEDGFIPETWQRAFGDDGEFREGTVLGYGLQLAVSGVLAWGPAFLTGMFTLGPGKQEYEYHAGTETRQGSGMTTNQGIKLGLGLNGKTFFLVLSGVSESPAYMFEHMTLSATRQEAQVMVGYKF